jgi:hypothetical protein
MIEDCPHAAVPLREIAHLSVQEIQAGFDLFGNFRRGQDPQPGDGQLNRQWQAFNQPAKMNNSRFIFVIHFKSRAGAPGALDEQGYRAVFT